MTEPRNALDVPAVLDRFAKSGQLLDEAADRVHALSAAADSAAESSAAMREAAQSLTITARSMGESLAALQEAQESVRQAMTVAREFLEATDISAVRETLHQLEERVSGLDQRTTGMAKTVTELGTALQQRLGAILTAVDRSAAMEEERNTAQERLSRVLEQIPARVAKKIQLPTS